METLEKLKILSAAAKYDVACTSSGIKRSGKKGFLGNAEESGICHSFSADGRCISLLKILLTNGCIYDCKYCVNRNSNDIKRATFTPREVADLTINFYKRNYIEGLFLSSAVIKTPNYTMERLYESLAIIRNEYKFNGYIHVKAIPGADKELIYKTGLLADRMSVNIELPSSSSLKILAPDKAKEDIFTPMKLLKNNIKTSKTEIALYKNAPKFVPAGQSTQLIVGATKESDKKILNLSEGLYNKYGLKRVFFSAYNPVENSSPLLPTVNPPLLREHRLYQVDWLMRFYKFNAKEIFSGKDENLNLLMDPKCQWAINNLDKFPVEINKASYDELLRVPGIGIRSARKIIMTRREARLNFDILKKMGISLKRAKFFITCSGKTLEKISFNEEFLQIKLVDDRLKNNYNQLSFFHKDLNLLMPSKKEKLECLVGEI